MTKKTIINGMEFWFNTNPNIALPCISLKRFVGDNYVEWMEKNMIKVPEGDNYVEWMIKVQNNKKRKRSASV